MNSTPTMSQIKAVGHNLLTRQTELREIVRKLNYAKGQDLKCKFDDQAHAWQESIARLRSGLQTYRRQIEAQIVSNIKLQALQVSNDWDQENLKLDQMTTTIDVYLNGQDPTPPNDGEKYVAVARIHRNGQATNQWRCRERLHPVNGKPGAHNSNCGAAFEVTARDNRDLVKTLHTMHKIVPVWQYTGSDWVKIA